ncbi:hypothetical protein ACFQPG_00990 [Sphingomonas sp. GCM10030256]|uniref:hypothetical protein n=1 Tax=Sphingomonas sp. GCM10030256 TaxID=3273427 RepID=UPI00361F94C8
MARPLPTAKQTVDLAAPVRVSRIRRDPPPPAKTLSLHDRNERDKRNAVIGVVAFALALAIIALASASAAGWSPSQHSIVIQT